MKTHGVFIIISCSFTLRMRNVSDSSCRENQNVHFMFSHFYFFPPKIVLFMRCGKYGTARQATGDTILLMCIAPCMLDN